jgi:hypothetical protein
VDDVPTSGQVLNSVVGEDFEVEGLFTRRRLPGWDAWGNEIESTIQFP